MDFVFVDDARQSKPSRAGLGALVAMGGIFVPSGQVGQLEQALQKHCREVGFPPGEQFKWSPGKKETFMKTKLVGSARVEFYRNVLGLAMAHDVQCCVVIEDTTRQPARSASISHEQDVTSLFLERVQWACSACGQHGLVVAATPSGGPKNDEKFLSDCTELLQYGTEYMKLDKISLGVLTADSRRLRLLQLADVVTSCAVARVSGESNFSPDVWEMLRPMWRRQSDRIQGVGLKLHPDFVLANLYYWLLGERFFWKANSGYELPIQGFPFYESAEEAAIAQG